MLYCMTKTIEWETSKQMPMISELKGHGMSLNQIARELNGRKILTARGNEGSWTAQGVKNVLARG